MHRVDVSTNEWTGFVIFDDRGPFQAMYRRFGFVRFGNDNGVYWSRYVDELLEQTMPIDIRAFIEFVNEQRLTELNKRAIDLLV